MNTASADKARAPVAPWWRQGYCWLVISGPLAVVIASLVTGVIVYRGADTMSAVYISEHRAANADRRAVLSTMPAEAVSKGALRPAVTR